jgi:hypothetical protein
MSEAIEQPEPTEEEAFLAWGKKCNEAAEAQHKSEQKEKKEAKFRMTQKKNRVVDYHDFYQSIMKKYAEMKPSPIRNSIIDIISSGGFAGDYTTPRARLVKARNRVQISVIRTQYDEAIHDCDLLASVLKSWREYEAKENA